MKKLRDFLLIPTPIKDIADLFWTFYIIVMPPALIVMFVHIFLLFHHR